MKLLKLLCFSLLMCGLVLPVPMVSSSGPNQGGTGADGGGGGVAWVNPGNAVTENSSSATFVSGSSDSSDYLTITNFGTFPGVAAGDLIATLTIEVRCSQTVTPQIAWSTFDFILSGTPQGNDFSAGSAGAIGASLAYLLITVDPAGDLGVTLHGSDLANGQFGLNLGFVGGGIASTASVDAVRVTVTGTFTGGGSNVSKSAGFFMQGKK